MSFLVDSDLAVFHLLQREIMPYSQNVSKHFTFGSEQIITIEVMVLSKMKLQKI